MHLKGRNVSIPVYECVICTYVNAECYALVHCVLPCCIRDRCNGKPNLDACIIRVNTKASQSVI